MSKKVYLITGGCGFIGSCLIRELLKDDNTKVINIDKLSYASNPSAIGDVSKDNYIFYQEDISDRNSITNIIKDHNPHYIINLAAESHVDRSIDGPEVFIKSNITGTFNILDLSYQYWLNLGEDLKSEFKFIHVSTDEVYGTLNANEKPFIEESAYKPNNPYSASKASSDHLVRAWNETYNFPSIITNTTNNYGPWQFYEKLIPLVITKCLNGQPIPVYGDGKQVRDWIHVEDHVNGILTVLSNGSAGEKYNIGNNNEIENIAVVNAICNLLDDLLSFEKGHHNKLIQFVKDRPGHDQRYALNNKKVLALGWKPQIKWDDGIKSTVEWYLKNKNYLNPKDKESYSGERLGTI